VTVPRTGRVRSQRRRRFEARREIHGGDGIGLQDPALLAPLPVVGIALSHHRWRVDVHARRVIGDKPAKLDRPRKGFGQGLGQGHGGVAGEILDDEGGSEGGRHGEGPLS